MAGFRCLLNESSPGVYDRMCASEMLQLQPMKQLILSIVLMLSLATFVRAEAPTTRPADFKPTTPKELVGKWIYGSVSPVTYWDRTTGQFQGNARGTAGIYE